MTDMSVREKKKAETRHLLMTSAVQVFHEKGIYGTRVSDIVSRAGVAQGTFYNHFQSKEAMFKAIADEVDLPIVLYNIPSRCGAGLTPETIARLAGHENIVAIKEATGSLDQASEIAMRCDMTIISGDDSLTLPLASVGGKGVISVVANIVPADVKAMTDLILEGDLAQARQWHRKLFALSKNMLTLATNPIPIKAAMAMLDLASDELRLPMTPLEESKKTALRKTLLDYGLLS